MVLPTYVAGEPDPNPMFFFGRASQGAEGRVYPYPLYDTLTGRKEDRAYRVVYLENEHVRIGVLPEIGGRLFEGVDKSNGYDFVYRQHVIKPALIGLIGAWISGGIEWNIPHHHRATTFLPVQHRIEESPDGSRTVWVGELELRHRMRWAVGYTLRPGSSLVEARLRVVNRTPLPHTLLCFANVAVHVNEDYQVVFPPRTQFVTHHHKREVTTWPIATGRYGGWDFGTGTDVSWFRNHTAANSMFAWNYEDDFLAGYDHGKQAGLMSVADHHEVPGKKLWTWGNGPRGRMWDRILTDTDGPYIELMVGGFSDNQPDYSWLQPGEAKAFSMFWYPFRGIGGAKNATLDAAVNLDLTHDVAKVGFCTTRSHRQATITLAAGGTRLLDERVAIDPARPAVRTVTLPPGTEPSTLRAALVVEGRELVSYAPRRWEAQTRPKPVEPFPAPKEMGTVEELYLAGLRLEQFHHATLEPDGYWDEALRRDPGDVRVNTAWGIRRVKQGRYPEAERHLRQALERLTDRHTTPKDGEPFYYLGVALQAQERFDEAFDAYRKAAWSDAWTGAADFGAAEIASRLGRPEEALALVDRALERNARNVRALNLKSALLRRAGRAKEVPPLLAAAREADPLDVRTLAEAWLARRDRRTEAELRQVLAAHPATALETAVEYGAAGLWTDGEAVLGLRLDAGGDPVSPLVHYLLAEFAERQGSTDRAAASRRAAAAASPEYVFPFQNELIPILRRAIAATPDDARAPYYLGNLLFDGQPEEAAALWQRSVERDPTFPVAHRNLAVARAQQRPTPDLDGAIASLERAVALPRPYPRHFTELDEYHAAAGTPPARRLAVLERNADTVAKRDDALARLIALLVWSGRYDEAIGRLTGRSFAVWEGASLSVAEHWTDAHLLRGRERLAAGRPRDALADFEAAESVPDNLPSENRGSGHREAELAWWRGLAREALGESEPAVAAWRQATRSGRDGTASAYFAGRAWQRLGESERAGPLFRELIRKGEQRLREGGTTDYFASFGERQSRRTRTAEARYLAGLGHLGLGEVDAARKEFAEALDASPDHLGARVMSGPAR